MQQVRHVPRLRHARLAEPAAIGRQQAPAAAAAAAQVDALRQPLLRVGRLRPRRQGVSGQARAATTHYDQCDAATRSISDYVSEHQHSGSASKAAIVRQLEVLSTSAQQDRISLCSSVCVSRWDGGTDLALQRPPVVGDLALSHGPQEALCGLARLPDHAWSASGAGSGTESGSGSMMAVWVGSRIGPGSGHGAWGVGKKLYLTAVRGLRERQETNARVT